MTEVEAPAGDELRYRLAGDGRPLRLAYSGDGAGVALGKFARNLLKIAQRDFERALETPAVAVDSPRRELWASRNKGWLSPAELEETNVLLERLSELTSRPRTAHRDRLISLAFVLAPVSPRPKRR